MPKQTVLLISTATEWDGLYFPPCWGVKSFSEEEGSWQPVLWLTVSSERMNILFIQGDGPTE